MDFRDDAAQITLDFPTSEPHAGGATSSTSPTSAGPAGSSPRRTAEDRDPDRRMPVTLRALLKAAGSGADALDQALPEVREFLRAAPRVPANGVLAQAIVEAPAAASAPAPQNVAEKAVA